VSTAARVVLDMRSPTIASRLKADRTPVTAADLAAQRIVLEGLARLLPGLPVVSEEAVPLPEGTTPLPERFALLDPLDGTKEFLAGRDEFSINLALVEAGKPVLGIVNAPARGLVWRGVVPGVAERLHLEPGAAPDQARERTLIHARRRPDAGLTAVTSRSHLDADTEGFLARLPAVHRIACGSALKFGLVADGTADIYPRLSPTSEWDIAAGHAVVAAAGGCVVAPTGEALRYGGCGRDFRVRGFVAYGDPALAASDPAG
jgi:3'(2'), 5'-bisphosphate nucleotidase